MSAWRVALFLVVALTLPALAMFWVGHRIISPLRLSQPWLGLSWSLIGLCWLSMPFSFMLGRVIRFPGWENLQQICFVSMGLISFLISLVLLRDLGWLLLRAGDSLFVRWTDVNLLPADPLPRLRLLSSSGLLVVVLSLFLVLLGFLGTRREPVLEKVEVILPALPPSYEGFRIVQISDIHLSSGIGASFMEPLVERINAMEPDLVAITGDLVDGTVEELGESAASISRIRAREGVFFVTGNHEYYSGPEAWVRELERLGVHVLQNQHRLLARDQQNLLIAGVPDHHGARGSFGPAGAMTEMSSSPRAALQGAPPVAVKILLAHQPASAVEAADVGFDLMLCGHTHGGQFWPWTRVVPLVQLFNRGLGTHGRLQVYTSPGTGWWGPPLRLGTRSEITLIELRSRAPVDQAG